VALDLPEPEDDFDRKLVSDIHEYGWHCILVADEYHPQHAKENAAFGPHPVYDATFVYTVGLWLTYEHPELILVGRWKQAHAIIIAGVSLIEDGARLAPGDESDQVLQGYPVRFAAVSKSWRDELLTYASWANRRRAFEALQLVLPDKDGHWPLEQGYSGYPQPLLDERLTVK
jgi:hypothetical protein